jgi:hypothetical protein
MMSSSDGHGVAGKASVAVEPGISAAAVSEPRHGASDGSRASSAEAGDPAPAGTEPGREAVSSLDSGSREPGDPWQDDPWFGAAPHPSVETGSLAAAYGNGSSDDAALQRAREPAQTAFDPEATLVDWFLPGGRAALLPESMTLSAGEGEAGRRQQQQAPAAAAGVPPWAGETTGSAGGTPPPWENGPWPGPGGDRPSRPSVVSSPRPGQPAAPQDELVGPLTPRAVLLTGLLPVVVPGLVVGLLGLRRSRSGEPGRRASVLALAASLAWAVIIVVLVVASTGGSSGGCSYPAGVHQAYTTAIADLSGSAPAAKTATDLGLAASQANSAATAAGEIQVRTALLAMAGDLQQARGDVIANRPVPASLRTRVTADGAALTASCPS